MTTTIKYTLTKEDSGTSYRCDTLCPFNVNTNTLIAKEGKEFYADFNLKKTTLIGVASGSCLSCIHMQEHDRKKQTIKCSNSIENMKHIPNIALIGDLLIFEKNQDRGTKILNLNHIQYVRCHLSHIIFEMDNGKHFYLSFKSSKLAEEIMTAKITPYFKKWQKLKYSI